VLNSTLTLELKRGSLAAQESLGRMLGAVDYDSFPACLQPSIKTLLGCVDRNVGVFNSCGHGIDRGLEQSGAFRSNVEARRNCFAAMPRILNNISAHISQRNLFHTVYNFMRTANLERLGLTPMTVISMFDALLGGLTDYTIDERGDVGSWIRIACIRGLTSFIGTLIDNACNISNFKQYLPSEKYHEAIRGILKQGVERLDNVRQESGECLRRILRLAPPASVPDPGNWVISNSSFFTQLFIKWVNSSIPALVFRSV